MTLFLQIGTWILTHGYSLSYTYCTYRQAYSNRVVNLVQTCGPMDRSSVLSNLLATSFKDLNDGENLERDI